MKPEPGDLVEVADIMDALMLTCWPYGLVMDLSEDKSRVYVAMVGDFVSRTGNGAGCRVWLPEDLRVIHRPTQHKSEDTKEK